MQVKQDCQLCGLSESLEEDHVLNNQELSFHPTQVASATRVVHRLRGSINSVEAATGRLEALRSRMKACLAKQMSYFAPVHRLPNETMLHIFQFLVDKAPSTESEIESW